MMITTGIGFTLLWTLHIFSVIAFFTGLLFLIVIAIRTFTPEKLRSVAMSLITIGIVACLFTIFAIGRPWIGSGFFGLGIAPMHMSQMDQMMNTLNTHDAGSNDPEHMQMERMIQRFRQNGRQGDLLFSP